MEHSASGQKQGTKKVFILIISSIKKTKQKVMQKQTTALLNLISSKHLANLTNVVNETIATGFYAPKAKTFTAADLWNIQRQGSRRIQRRML